jgi:hypothetical protein
MAATSPRYGLDAKIYRNTGSYGTPSWTELTFVRDVTVAGAATEGDVSTRGSRLKVTAAVMLDYSIDVEMLKKDDDTSYQALLDVFNHTSAGQTIELLIIDGAVSTTGNEGLRAHFSVVKFDDAQPLDGVQMVSATIKPGPYASGQAPTWYTS